MASLISITSEGRDVGFIVTFTDPGIIFLLLSRCCKRIFILQLIHNQLTSCYQLRLTLRPHLDAVALPHGHPHGEGGGGDAAEDVQQRQTQTLPVLTRGHTGEAGQTPTSKTTCRRSPGRETRQLQLHSEGPSAPG